jgi:hypothetical protein
MTAFIYFREQIDFTLDEIEDALDRALLNIGEVNGTGVGKTGSNIDIVITDASVGPDTIAKVIGNALKSFAVPRSIVIKVEGREYGLLLFHPQLRCAGSPIRALKEHNLSAQGWRCRSPTWVNKKTNRTLKAVQSS